MYLIVFYKKHQITELQREFTTQVKIWISVDQLILTKIEQDLVTIFNGNISYELLGLRWIALALND